MLVMIKFQTMIQDDDDEEIDYVEDKDDNVSDRDSR